MKKEIIGQEVKIVSSTNPAHVGIKGKVVDETKNTLVIETATGDKRLLKGNIVLWFPKLGQKVAGTSLIKRPEDRIK